MTILPETDKVYACEESDIHCFVCVGKDKCTNYRLDFYRDMRELLIDNLKGDTE